MASVTISVPVSDAAGSTKTATATATTTTTTFPTAATTGVPGGTAGMSAQPSGGTSITASVSNKSFTSSVIVTASNITIDHCYFAGGLHLRGTNIIAQNCYIKGSIANTTGFVSLEGSGCKLLNSEVDGGAAQVSQDGVWMGSGTTVQGCNIHGWSKSVYCGGSNLLISGSYLWGIVSAGEHTENIFIDGLGSSGPGTQTGIQIRGCNINCNLVSGVSNAGPVFIKDDFGAVSGVIIDSTLLVGGGYTIFAEVNLADVTNISVTNCVLGKGQFGYAYSAFSGSNVWSGNVDQATGNPV